MTADTPPRWRLIATMPWNQHVIVSDGALVKPGIRINEDTVAAPILMRIGMWTHWMPLPPPPGGEGDR
jgi:hypothetical protein